ncbi:MAG: hypothetical protein ABJ308_11670 [Halieaceae bacterium]
MSTTKSLINLLITPALLVAAAVHAESPGGGLRASFTPKLLSLELKEDEQDNLQEARINSGLGLALQNDLLEFALDYQLQSRLQDHGRFDENVLSQQLGASLHSSALNELLGLDADIHAGSTIKAGGDAYQYRIAPAVSKSIADLARLSVAYEYSLDKASAAAEEQQKTGYSMGLNGSVRNGRLTWKGNYRSTDTYAARLDQVQSIELLEFESRYQLIPELSLEVSGANKDETLFDEGLANEIVTETRYGAGLAWSPSAHYSVAFKVNRLDETRHKQDEVFGSGAVSWFPQPNLEFKLSYGDHLVEGARGLMLSTRIDLNDS